MKSLIRKMLLICFVFAYATNFYAQDTKAEKAKKEVKKTAKKTADKTKKVAKAVKAETKEVAQKSSKAAAKTADKVADKTKKAAKEVKTKTKKATEKVKETTEKAPKKPDRVTGTYNGKKVYTGPRGGRYYINANGNKTYIQD